MLSVAVLLSSTAFVIQPSTGPFAARVGPAAVRTTTVALSGKVKAKNVWTDFVPASEATPGTITAGFKFGQELAIINVGGKLYAMSNKLPPLGQPATSGSIEKFEGKSVLVEAVSGTAFDLNTGKHVGPWCPSIVGRFLIRFLVSPEKALMFPCRKQGNKVQALINVNLKAQFEEKYWRGVLDSQGKVDGGYY
jgi:nitrite reductase/ring-hydroxylating ferredoxin subunit